MNATTTTGLGFSTDNLLQIIALILTACGGAFALWQWIKSNEYNRSEYVGKIITKLRDDEDIAFVMELIDWNNGFYYDGAFHYSDSISQQDMAVSEERLFQKIDKTLAHFSYVCYLHKNNIISADDMAFYEYALRRLIDNPYISDYLYSLYHWSASRQVRCSFVYLIEYALKNDYLNESFKSKQCSDYSLWLNVPED